MLFQPGKSGNPAGRKKKGYALADLLNNRLDQPNDDGVPARVVMLDRLVSLACAGEYDAVKIVLDRVYGKVPELHTNDGRLKIALKWDDGSGD